MISALVWANEALVLWFLVRLLAPAPITIPAAITIDLLSGTAGMASSLPGGIGVNEAATVLLLGQQGVPAAVALPVAVLRRLITLWSMVAPAAATRVLSLPIRSARQAKLSAIAAIDTIAIRSAFVLGSTSEVSKAICRELASRGCGRFHLVARNREANQVLATELEGSYGTAVSTEQTDLLADRSLNSVRRPQVGDFDLYLITAGSLGDAELARVDAAEAMRILAANVGGLIPWITAIATPERLDRPGRLWVFSSVAADRGRPSNYHYGAAKAALTALCEGLFLRCHGKPFVVRIIKAGFMATPMTVGKAPPFLCTSPESVARDLLRHPNRRGIEYLPWWWSPLMQLIRVLPAPIASKL